MLKDSSSVVKSEPYFAELSLSNAQTIQDATSIPFGNTTALNIQADDTVVRLRPGTYLIQYFVRGTPSDPKKSLAFGIRANQSDQSVIPESIYFSTNSGQLTSPGALTVSGAFIRTFASEAIIDLKNLSGCAVTLDNNCVGAKLMCFRI
jgi:hypothetical protein